MKNLRFVVAVLLSIFSTAVMSYISMATPIGPWIEMTVVLISMIIFNIFSYRGKEYSNSLGLVAASGGIGGILATGCGFSFPAIYFLDKITFNSWMAHPIQFILILSSLAFSAGSFGLVSAQILEEYFIDKQKMSFPIGELVYKMISGVNQFFQAILLALGFISTFIFLSLQSVGKFVGSHVVFICKKAVGIFIIPSVIIPLDMASMFLAVGFVTGHVIAIPLVVGVLSKIFCLEPLYYLYNKFYSVLTPEDFSVAFCSGIVLYGAVIGFLQLIAQGYKKIKKIDKNNLSFHVGSVSNLLSSFIKKSFWPQIIFVLIINLIFLSYFNFSLISQIYLQFFTFISVFQVLIIAGKIGLAPLGRFATFVMVPGMLLFGFSLIQTIFVATYVEIASGVAADVLFGRKMSHLANIDNKSIMFYQWLGLVVASCCVGLIFWLLINTFGFGNNIGALAVNKALGRALLINIKSFNFTVLALGLFFGYILKFIKVNPVLVLGALLMPVYISLLLILGGAFTYLIKDKESLYPFWSGVFAANSIWMIIKAIFMALGG